MDLSQSILNVIDSSAGDFTADKKKILSFEQFVSFLIQGSRMPKMNPQLSREEHLNTHWFPYWKLCSPCHPHTMPNTIVKLDEGHFEQEVRRELFEKVEMKLTERWKFNKMAEKNRLKST